MRKGISVKKTAAYSYSNKMLSPEACEFHQTGHFNVV